jgi:hypothetical protein
MALIEKPCRRNRCMSSLVMAWILPPSKRISGTSQACPNRVGQLPAKRIPLRANGEGLRLLRIGTLRANRGGFGDCLSRARDAAQTLPTGHPAAARRVGPRRGAFGGLGVRGLLVVGLGGRGALLGGRLGSRSGVVRRARAVLARGPRALEETLRIRCSQRQPPVIGRCPGPTLAACIGLVDLASQRSDTGLFCSDARSWSSACADVLLGGAW